MQQHEKVQKNERLRKLGAEEMMYTNSTSMTPNYNSTTEHPTIYNVIISQLFSPDMDRGCGGKMTNNLNYYYYIDETHLSRIGGHGTHNHNGC